MTHPTNRAAYPTALSLASNLATIDLWSDSDAIFQALEDLLIESHPDLTAQGARQVAAKAIRVERGRRKKSQ